MQQEFINEVYSNNYILRSSWPEQIRHTAVQILENAAYFTADPDKFLQATGKMIERSYNNFGALLV